MIVAIIEFHIRPGAEDLYAEWAAKLHAQVHTIDGFVSVERFESVTTPGKYLSLSVWRDEAAVLAWRSRTAHRFAQAQGRGGIFADYRLRVAAVVRDYGMNERTGAPPDSRDAHG